MSKSIIARLVPDLPGLEFLLRHVSLIKDIGGVSRKLTNFTARKRHDVVETIENATAQVRGLAHVCIGRGNQMHLFVGIAQLHVKYMQSQNRLNLGVWDGLHCRCGGVVHCSLAPHVEWLALS